MRLAIWLSHLLTPLQHFFLRLAAQLFPQHINTLLADISPLLHFLRVLVVLSAPKFLPASLETSLLSSAPCLAASFMLSPPQVIYTEYTSWSVPQHTFSREHTLRTPWLKIKLCPRHSQSSRTRILMLCL